MKRIKLPKPTTGRTIAAILSISHTLTKKAAKADTVVSGGVRE